MFELEKQWLCVESSSRDRDRDIDINTKMSVGRYEYPKCIEPKLFKPSFYKSVFGYLYCYIILNFYVELSTNVS